MKIVVEKVQGIAEEITILENKLKALRAEYVKDCNIESLLFERIKKVYGIKKSVLKSRNRKQSISLVRQVMMYVLTDFYSLAKVGEILGNRDHTTVIHAKKRIRELLNDVQDDLIVDIHNILISEVNAKLNKDKEMTEKTKKEEL